MVVPGETLAEARALLGEAPTLVAGGDTRQHSIRHGLAVTGSDRVVIHDAARPLVTVGMVRSVLDLLDEADAATVGVRLDETVKRAAGGVVVQTVPREDLWRAQTPQAFRTGPLKEAHALAAANGIEMTDDAGLMEWAGGRVAIVEGSRSNFKLTYDEDFAVAEAILEGRG